VEDNNLMRQGKYKQRTDRYSAIYDCTLTTSHVTPQRDGSRALRVCSFFPLSIRYTHEKSSSQLSRKRNVLPRSSLRPLPSREECRRQPNICCVCLPLRASIKPSCSSNAWYGPQCPACLADSGEVSRR
jgi:hypothetical protein